MSYPQGLMMEPEDRRTHFIIEEHILFRTSKNCLEMRFGRSDDGAGGLALKLRNEITYHSHRGSPKRVLTKYRSRVEDRVVAREGTHFTSAISLWDLSRNSPRFMELQSPARTMSSVSASTLAFVDIHQI
ncbi:hypothetical protein EVAR_15857_1 [Eumeta japonica]|uniref:Uncharacterized protein n=1 Tax=Eumeta variegata TaxID=151549 RepID=A0A4C1UDX4_EUMVA|nr:hypothetical protein EVAR_15857_1 [Eumeta japonica]